MKMQKKNHFTGKNKLKTIRKNLSKIQIQKAKLKRSKNRRKCNKSQSKSDKN